MSFLAISYIFSFFPPFFIWYIKFPIFSYFFFYFSISSIFSFSLILFHVFLLSIFVNYHNVIFSYLFFYFLISSIFWLSLILLHVFLLSIFVKLSQCPTNTFRIICEHVLIQNADNLNVLQLLKHFNLIIIHC